MTKKNATVGFPGETDRDITVLLAALQRWRLDHVGVFQYQDEDGSPVLSVAGESRGGGKGV